MLLLIDFYTPDCGTCQTMEPVWDELKKKMNGEIEFHKIDLTEKLQIAQKYRIMNTPCFILFRGGEEIWRHTGLITLRKMETEISRFISSEKP